MTFSFNLAGVSSVAAIAAHAAFNTAFKFLGGIFKGVEPRIQIPFEMLLAVCGLAVAIVLIILTIGRLAYREDMETAERPAIISSASHAAQLDS